MKTSALYLRTIIFGINDSLVSTVGFLAGISVAGVPRATIALTGIVYAFVEAFSMAMGDFLSEESAEEYMSKSVVNNRHSITAAVFMFISCVFASLIPLIPYIIFPSGTALIVSVTLSVVSLFIVGMVSARFSRLPMIWRGVRMALLGGAAIVMGVAIGTFMPAV
ncbi:MAG: VIT1/CCC1 transporter family protein [bacterium]|nr:VIT1/CCC1 transporter family protein [bacterium]